MKNTIRAFCERANGMTEAPAGTPIRFIAGTEGIKRDGLDLKMGGARLDNYRRNPVILWGHDYMGQRLPIGRADAVVEGDRLYADVTFDQEDEFARQIESKYRRGFLNAVSMGWNTLRMDGRQVTDWELLDISAVPVPGDADALIERQARALKDTLRALEGDDDLDDPAQTWETTAIEMVRLFFPAAWPCRERDRKRTYNTLARQYRQLDKEPPEYLSADACSALGPDELRGLFLEDEPSLFGFWPSDTEPGGQRVGAVLSGRNKGDLEQIVTLAQGILERAKKEDSTGQDDERGVPEGVPEWLQDIRNQLDNQLGRHTV